MDLKNKSDQDLAFMKRMLNDAIDADVATRRVVNAHTLDYKGTAELAKAYGAVEYQENELSLNDVPTDDFNLDVETGDDDSNVQVEAGVDLLANELSDEPATKRGKAEIKSARRTVAEHPERLYTYINTYEMGQRGPVNERYAVEYTSPVTVSMLISNVIAGYNAELVQIAETQTARRYHAYAREPTKLSY